MSAGDAPAGAAPLRLFFALWPSEAQQQSMAQATADCTTAIPARPIPGGNLHITLAFLGNVEAARLSQLRALARQLSTAARTQALQLQFSTVEHWPRPQILCATADAHTVGGATALAATLRQAALAAGFSPDLKPFRAHVTIARKVVHAAAPRPMPEVTWKLDAFALVSSVISAAGSLYSVVESYPLDRRQNTRK